MPDRKSGWPILTAMPVKTWVSLKPFTTTAHRLMQRFGSLHAVLEATEDELQTVEGVGPRSAELLHLCFALFHRYQADVAKMEHKNIR